MPQLVLLDRHATTTSRHKSVLPRFEISGPAGAPVIIVLGGISATRHVTATEDDPAPGWWEPVVGPCRAIDTTRFRVLGIDFLDGGKASTGRPARTVTTHDQAYAVRRVLDFLGVRRACAVVGASYGGMVALAFAERYATRVERLIVIGAAHEPHPMSTAVRSVQRGIVELGLDAGRAQAALALARSLAMTTYRSAREFGERFDALPLERGAADAEFPVERYLRHCGERFAATWSAERFLALSLSADLHRVDPAAIRVPTVLVAAEGDLVVPPSQLEQLARAIGAHGKLVSLPTTYGHDAFLTEPEKISEILQANLIGIES